MIFDGDGVVRDSTAGIASSKTPFAVQSFFKYCRIFEISSYIILSNISVSLLVESRARKRTMFIGYT